MDSNHWSFFSNKNKIGQSNGSSIQTPYAYFLQTYRYVHAVVWFTFKIPYFVGAIFRPEILYAICVAIMWQVN